MRMDKLTLKAQEALAEAQATAAQAGHAQVSPLHLLDALLRQEGGLTASLLVKVGIPAERIGSVVSSELKRLPSQSSQAGMAMDPATVRAGLAAAQTEGEQET